MKQQNNELAMLQQLGISLDPMAGLSGLVNLINQSQQPGIQQGQFEREMGFRELMGQQGQENQQAQLQQRQAEHQAQQGNFQQSYRLQERGQQQQMANDDRRYAQSDDQFSQSKAMQEQQMLQSFLSMFIGSAPEGHVNPAAAINQIMGQMKLPSVVGPQQQDFGPGARNGDIPDAAILEAMRKNNIQPTR